MSTKQYSGNSSGFGSIVRRVTDDNTEYFAPITEYIIRDKSNKLYISNTSTGTTNSLFVAARYKTIEDIEYILKESLNNANIEDFDIIEVHSSFKLNPNFMIDARIKKLEDEIAKLKNERQKYN